MKNVFSHNLTPYLFATFLLSPLCYAESAANGPDRFRVGLGFKTESSHFVGVENENMVIPRVDIKYLGFYWRGPKLGYRVIENENFEIGPLLRPFEGFEVKSADIREGYKGITEREGNAEYGINASFSFGDFKAGITPLWNAEGSSIELSLKYKIIGENYIIKPEITYQRYDDDSMNHYFGVTANEANHALSYLISSPYTAKSNSVIGFNVIAAYMFSENWFVMGRVSYDKFGSDILDSPIVNSDSSTSFALGIGYSF